jgi:16S rRNA (guanine527-N7)-methyltransferase
VKTGAPHLRALLEERCAAIGVELPPGAGEALLDVLAAMGGAGQNLTAIHEPAAAAVDRHLVDSLAGLTLPEVRAARSLVDVGSGAGFPGLALAAARPELAVTLVESEGRKAAWLAHASARFRNVRVVAERSETLAARARGSYDVASARALGPPPVALELCAPLVGPEGAVVLWRGLPGAAEAEDRLRDAAATLGLAAAPPTPVAPFPGARRALQVARRVGPTPGRFPRRPGRAGARPLARWP